MHFVVKEEDAVEVIRNQVWMVQVLGQAARNLKNHHIIGKI
jgi:hypothetical protein